MKDNDNLEILPFIQYYHFFFSLWKIHISECLLLRSMKLYTRCMCGIIYIPILFHKISEVAYKKNNKTA